MRIAIARFALPVVVMLTTATMGSAATMTLYDRLGGKPAITAVVNQFVANVAADKRINKFFAADVKDPARLPG